MLDKNAKKLEKLIQQFKEEIKEEDFKTAHGTWDKIMELRMREFDPKLLARLRRIKKESPFWYV